MIKRRPILATIEIENKHPQHEQKKKRTVRMSISRMKRIKGTYTKVGMFYTKTHYTGDKVSIVFLD